MGSSKGLHFFISKKILTYVLFDIRLPTSCCFVQPRRLQIPHIAIPSIPVSLTDLYHGKLYSRVDRDRERIEI